MSGVITGAGLGLFGSSANVLGGAGVLGQGQQGRPGAGSRVYVNAVNGNLVLQSPDDILSGRGADLALLRTYNLQGTISSASNGLGWSWDGGDGYVFLKTGPVNGANSVVTRVTGDGHATDYKFNGTAYVSTDGDGAHDTLVHSGTAWTWIDGSARTKEVYGESLDNRTNGLLQSRTDASGNQIAFTRSGALLTGIRDVKSGLRYELIYTGTPARLSQVNTFELNDATNAPIKQVSYTYYDDGTNRLKSVSSYLKPGDPASRAFVTTYAYEGTSNRISSVTQNDGSSLTAGAKVSFTYEQVPGSGANGVPVQFRVTSVTDANGIQTFTYNADHTTKITIAGPGNVNPQSWIYTYDGQQQLVTVQAPDVNGATIRTNFIYDSAGNLIKTIDARGLAVTYQYDLNGNLQTQRDSMGNTITRTYDSNNQLLTETHYTTPDAAGIDDNTIGKGSASGALITRFVYDQKSQLRFVISAEGRVMENRYTIDGLLERTIHYAGGRYDVNTLAVDTSPTEDQMTAWIAQTALDKKQIELTQLTYDFRGNLSRRVDFASADASGAGVMTDPGNVVTDFSYDGHGNLLQSLVRHGTAFDKGTPTIYVYDGLGRLISATDAAGIQTTTAYDDLLGTITVKTGVGTATASHLATIRSFNSVGQLISVSQADTDTLGDPARVTRYVYDEQGRLRLTLDPQGGRHFNFYDAAGRLAFVVDSTGVVTGFTYDEDGHPLTETHYANRLKGVDDTHPASVVTAAWLDNATNPTRVRIQTLVLGTDLVAVPAQDRTNRFHYDNANRLDQRTDAAGTSTLTRYDGDSRVERQTTSERVTRSFYDHDGKLVGVLDPLGNLVEYKYNAAGELVQTIRYATRSPLAVDSSRPVWVGADAGNVIQTSATGGKPFTLRIPLVDADGDTMDVTVVSKPAWVTVTKDEGGVTLTGTPPPTATLISHEIRLTAVEKRTAGFSTDVTVKVNVNNAPPSWGPLPDFTITNKRTIDPAPLLPVATDAESPGSALQYSFAGLPAGVTASFNATANTLTFAGTPSLPGFYVVVATVRDPQGLTTQKTFTIQVADAGAPIVAPMAAQTATRTQSFNLVSMAPVDPDGQEAQFQYTVLEKPSWLNVTTSLSTITFTGTPPKTTPAGVQWVRIEVADPQYGSSVISFPITVLNAPPTGWPADFGEIRVTSATIDFTPPPATDPEGSTLIYDVFNLTPGMSHDTTNGRIWGTIQGLVQGGTRTIQLQARDSENGAAVSQVTFRFDQAPVYNGGVPGVMGHRALPITIPANTFTDADGDPLNVQASGLPPGVSFDGRTFFGTPTTLGTWPITVTATDPYGLSVSVASLIFRDADPPPPPHNPPPSPFPGPRPPILPQFTVPLSAGAGALAGPTGPMEEPPAPELVSEGAAAQVAAAVPPPPLPVTTLTPVEDVLAAARPATNDKDLRSFRFYDGAARNTVMVDELGFVTENVFDLQLNQQRTLRYTKAVTVAASMTVNDVRTAAGAVAKSTIVQFNDVGRAISSKDVVGTTEVSVARFEYDSAGRVTRRVEAAGSSDERSSRMQYDAFGELTAVLGGEADGVLSKNPAPTRTDVENAAAANGTRYIYNSLGQRIRSFGGGPDPKGNDRITLSYFDSEGRLAYTINALGEVTELLYDSFSELKIRRRYFNRLSKDQLQALQAAGGGTITSALTSLLPGLRDTANDQTTQFDYDQRGLLTQQIEAADSKLGLVTTRTYDLYGQLKTETRAVNATRNATTRLDYDLDGRVVSTTGDLNGINFNNQVRFDAFGRSVMTIDAAGRITSRTDYLDSGRTIEVRDVFSLDASGRDVAGHKVRTEFNNFSGRITKVIDATGKATSYEYDDAARSITVTTPEGVKIITVRTREGEALSVTHGTSVTTYGYNRDGQLLTVMSRIDGVDKTITANEYFLTTGLLKSTKDARGIVTQFSYDAANRMFQRRVDPKDLDGNPQTNDNPNGLDLVCTYEFTAFGQEMRVTEGHGDNTGVNVSKVTKFVYDQGGRQSQMIVDPDGLKHTTTFAYDGLGNAITVSQGTSSNPNQLVTSYEFDNLGRRVREIVNPGNGSARDHGLVTSYRYDLAGNMTRRIDAAGNSTWLVYDRANRLTQTVNARGEVSETGYDDNGHVSYTRGYVNRLAPATVAAFGDSIDRQAPAPSNNDARTYFVLNGDGQTRYAITAQLGTTWAISEMVYDANGNVIERIDYDRLFDDTRDPSDATRPSPINTTLPVISTTAVLAELASLYRNATTADLAKVRHTHVAFDSANRARFTVDALGDVSESIYNDAGDVVQAIRFAKRPALTKFDADTIGRAVDRNDVNNQVTRFAYSAAGKLRFTVRVLASDGQGHATQQLISELRYDDLNRVIESISYATPYGSVADYREATLAAKVNESSNLRAQDRRTINAYDSAGHQVFQLRVSQNNAAGIPARYVATRFAYDDLDHLVQSTTFAKEITSTLADDKAATIAAAIVTSDQDRTTTFVLDGAGRQHFVIAADNTFTENVLDALGRVIERRQFDIVLTSRVPRTEAALMARRAGRTVGDGVTRGVKFSFDSTGKVVGTTDALGYREVNEYDGLGNLISFTDKGGNQWKYEYDRSGRLTKQTSPAVMLQLSSETAPQSRALITVLTYDAFGSLKTKDEASGTEDHRLTVYGYDLLCRQTIVETALYDPSLHRVVNGQPVDGDGRFWRRLVTDFDALGNAVRTGVRTGPANFQYEHRTFDNLGRIVHDVDAQNHVTKFTYTAFGEQRALTRYSDQVDVGKPTAASGFWSAGEIEARLVGDPASRTVTTDYDTMGRKTLVTQPEVSSFFYSQSVTFPVAASVAGVKASATMRYEYTAFGEIFREIQAQSDTRSQETWHYYNARGNETRTLQKIGDGNATLQPLVYDTQRDYDEFGNVKRVIEYAASTREDVTNPLTPPPAPTQDAFDRITGFRYDAQNQQKVVTRFGLKYTDENLFDVSKTRDQGTDVSTIEYDAMGRVKSVKDALMNVTLTQYDALGRVTTVTEPARLVKGNSIDPFLNQANVSPVTSLTYNAAGQIVTTTRSSGGVSPVITTHQAYDAAGNLISSIDAMGIVTSYEVDYAGRMTRSTMHVHSVLAQRLPSSDIPPAITWRTVDHDIDRRFAYDLLGRMTDALDVFKDDNGNVLQSGLRKKFNSFGDTIAEQKVWGSASTPLSALSVGTVTTYGYDNAGQLTTVQNAAGLTRFYYNLAGQMTRKEEAGNGSSTDGTSTRVSEMVFDLMGRALELRRPTLSTNEPGATSILWTPYTTLRLDRWGNVFEHDESAFSLNTLRSSLLRTTFSTYNADNKVTSESHGPMNTMASDGVIRFLETRHETHYDLLGRDVRDVDIARDFFARTDSEPLREHSRTFDAAGNVTSETTGLGTDTAFVETTRYAYDANSNKVGELNNLGTVTVDDYDLNGNVVAHSILRAPNRKDPYVSWSGQTAVAVLLNSRRFDQANRLIEEDEYNTNSFGEIQFKARFTAYDERSFARATFTLWERLLDGFPQGLTGGAETSCNYDITGNKTREEDAAHSVTTWQYDTTTDPTTPGVAPSLLFGQLRSVNVGGHVTDYFYNDFGQVKQEKYSGAGISDPTSPNQRVYSYNANGLVSSIFNISTFGTVGPSGGADYTTANSTTDYLYNSLGQISKETYRGTGFYEFETSPGIFQLKNLPTVNRSTSTSYDSLGRIRSVQLDNGGTGANQRSNGVVTYDYDALSNRRRITSSYTGVHVDPGASPQIDPATSKETWFEFDSEGRMTRANRIVQNGVQTDAGTIITYDLLGRRATARFEEGPKSTVVTTTTFQNVVDPTNGSIGLASYPTFSTYSWGQTRSEFYSYNDQGLLTTVKQAVIQNNKTLLVSYGFGTIINSGRQVPPLPSKPLEQLGTAGPTAVVLQSTRSYNLMGQVTKVEQYEPITFSGGGITDFHANLSTSTFSDYDANGHLSVETTLDNLHPENKSQTIFRFDIAGILRSSEFRFGPNNGIGGTPENFIDRYTYDYTFVDGGYKESLVTVTSTRPQAVTGTTTSRYDARGDLVTQTIDNQADDKRERRLFSYDAEGHVVTKDVIFTNKNETRVLTAGGSQDFIYSNGHQIGAIGGGSLSGTTQFSNDFTPVSSTYPLAQPSSHAVVAGDTLAGIAQAYLGDANLWYLIADANGVNAGPTQQLPPGEVGRIYRIPNVVDSLRNNASTFRPYNPSEIIGGSRPVPGLLPPPGESTCHQIAGVISLAVTLIVSAVGTYVLTPFIGPVAAGAIAGGAGNALGQLTYIAMGGKPIGDFSGWDVLEASAAGAVGGAFGGVTKGVTAGSGIYTQIAAQGISAGASAVANAGIHEFFNRVRNRDDEWNLTWEGLGESIGVGAAGALLSPAFDKLNGERLKAGTGVQQFLTNSFRPSGWVWQDESRQWSSLVSAAIGAGTEVAVGGVFAPRDQSAREDVAGHIADIVTESPYEVANIDTESPYGAVDIVTESPYDVADIITESPYDDGEESPEAVRPARVVVPAKAAEAAAALIMPDGITDADYLSMRKYGDDQVIRTWKTVYGTVEGTYYAPDAPNRDSNTPVDGTNYRYFRTDEKSAYAEINPRTKEVIDVDRPDFGESGAYVIDHKLTASERALMREYAAWDYMNAVEAQYERELQFRIAAGKELNPNPTGVRYSHGEPFEYKTHQEDYTDPVKHPLAEIEDELKYNGKWRWLADKKEDWMDRHVLKGNMGSEFDRIHNGIWYALDAALIPDSYTGVALTFLPGVVKAGQAVSRLAAEAELLGRAAPELVAIDAATLSAGNDLRDVSLATGNGGQSALAPGGVVRVGTATPGAAELAQANGELGEAIKYTFGNPVRTDNLVTFFGRTTGSEVAAEAEAAIQRGAKEINIGSGTHGVDEMAANQFGSDFEMVANDSHSGQFLQEDLDTARRLQQLYPDVKIKVYDTLNPAEYESFMRQVQRATPGSDVHAIAAWCHSVRTF